MSTIKHINRSKTHGETVFNGNKIYNLDLALFLLSKYNKFGFKSGVKELSSQIKLKDLLEEEFNN